MTRYKHLHHYSVHGRFATLVSLFCTRSVRNIFRFDKCLASFCQDTVKKDWIVLYSLFYWNWNDLSICLKAQVSYSITICSVFRSAACGRTNEPRRHFFTSLLRKYWNGGWISLFILSFLVGIYLPYRRIPRSLWWCLETQNVTTWKWWTRKGACVTMITN